MGATRPSSATNSPLSSSAAAPGDGEAHQGKKPGHGQRPLRPGVRLLRPVYHGPQIAGQRLVGAAAGVFAIARKGRPRLHHPGGRAPPPSKVLSDRLAQLTEYRGGLSSPPGGSADDGQPLSCGSSGHQPSGAGAVQGRYWSPATGWRSSTITAGPPPTIEGPPSTTTSPTPPPPPELVTEAAPVSPTPPTYAGRGRGPAG